MDRLILIPTIAIAGLTATTVVPPIELLNLEKIGIAAVTICMLAWMLKQERAERMEIQREFKKLQESVRNENGQVIARHEQALHEQSAAMRRLAEVLDRL